MSKKNIKDEKMIQSDEDEYDDESMSDEGSSGSGSED